MSTCSPQSAIFQNWSYHSQRLSIQGDANPLWSSTWCLSTGNGINTLPAAPNASLYTSPCGSALQLQLTPGAPRTALELAGGSLCVAVAPPGALPGVGLRLAPCDSPPSDAQAFSLNAATGALTHAASGLCVDSGSRFRGCAAGGPGAALPFCDASAPLGARVADLVSRLSFEEKVGMLATPSGGSAGLGVSPQQWWQESLHGLANNVGVAFDGTTPAATSFPQPILSSCSFNRSLWLATAQVVSTEVRAFANAGHSGLTLWAPNIVRGVHTPSGNLTRPARMLTGPPIAPPPPLSLQNIARDPRWGRIQETPGESAYVSGAYAEAYMRGMQEGEDARYLKTSACCKHFAAYSLENWEGMDRYHFDAMVSDEDLAEVYLPAFQACVTQGRASSTMCSYNSVSGVPSCASSFLLTQILREEWGFDGYVTSDCGAVSNIPQTHHYTNSSIATFAVTLPSGLDIGCDMLLVEAGVARQAVDAGAIAEADIDAAVTHLLSVRFRLGEFDDPSLQPYTRIGLDQVCTAEHIALARDSARQSLVLLHNPHGALPLSRSATRTMAVIGPFANSSRGTNGGPNYAGIPCGGAAETLLGALGALAPGLATLYAPGCASVGCKDRGGFPAATAAAAAADATLVVVGLDETIEDEALDRVTLTLPDNQTQLITAACSAARGPCVVVLMSGGGVDLSAALPAVTGGVFYAGFLGGHGAPAVVDTLFGASAPAGRLTQTFYPAGLVDAVSMLDMGMRPGASAFPPGSNPGRTYAFYAGPPAVWPFGTGLSYTTWSVSVEGPAAVGLARTRAYLAAHGGRHGGLYAPLREGAPVADYRVNVTNTGALDSDYVVLGFLVPPGAGAGGVPLQTLFGFARVRVAAGQTVQVWLGVGARELTRVVGRERVAVPGAWRVRVGVEGERGGAEVGFVAE